MTTPIKIDNEKEKEQALIRKFIEHRDFYVSWANNNAEEWMNHREKYGKEFLIPMAISSNIVTEPDKEGNVSFTEKFNIWPRHQRI
jgi:ribosomal protein L11 methylase PrmA